MNSDQAIRAIYALSASTCSLIPIPRFTHNDAIKLKPIPRWPDRASYIRRKKGGSK